MLVKTLLEEIQQRTMLFPPQTFQRYPRLNFANLTEHEHEDWFRFKQKDMELLCTELKIPADFKTPSRFRCTAVEAMHIFLWRLSFPNKWSFGVKVFGRGRSALSEINTYMINHVSTSFGHLLNLPQYYRDPKRLRAFADAIHGKGFLIYNCNFIYTYINTCFSACSNNITF